MPRRLLSPALLRVCLAAACLTAIACPAPTNPSEGEGTFEGLYLQGFEVSAFTPCGSGAPGSSTGYWLTGSADFSQRYSALATTRGPNAFGPTVYTRFVGTLSAEGRYGHLGAYKHEVSVKTVLEMTVRESCR
jgi:hypothetical protein